MTISTEQFIPVNVGSVANDGNGDSLRSAFVKLNGNFSNISDVGFDAGNINVMGALTLDATQAPLNSNDSGTMGQIVWDTGHIYVCVASNTWKRANLASW